MKNLKAFHYELEGTNYEVGKLLGEKMKAMPQFVEMQKCRSLLSQRRKKYKL
ncbi:hypothetical protein JQ035_14075 [Clostridium botulinum]|nr:hypothetical protein [Clostridium botulinum]